MQKERTKEMKSVNVTVNPFELIDLLECTIHKKSNEHATARIKGRISWDKEEEYLEDVLAETYATITVTDDSEEDKIVFNGVVTHFSIQTENGVRTVTADLISGTYLLDITPVTRSFQDKNMLYKSVINTILENYANSNFIMNVGLDSLIEDWLLQYEETDWEFFKRLASHFNSFLVPDYKVGGIKFFFGMPERSEPITIQPSKFSMQKDVSEFTYKTVQQVSGLRERDAIYYNVYDREIYDIGDILIMKDRTLRVYEIESSLVGNELYHKYSLKTEEGFQTEKHYNERMIGASLSAQVIDVAKDQVKVWIFVDESQDVGTARWFPYSTVYSSPDGTGWYCMPEIGDEVRLYLPCSMEQDGYVISSVHIGAGGRNNPDFKSIKNKYQKEILFTPDSLVFTNNNGMRIEIADGSGITIQSNKDINIQSSGAVNMASEGGAILVSAPSSIKLAQGGTSLTLSGNVKFAGGQIKVQ